MAMCLNGAKTTGMTAMRVLQQMAMLGRWGVLHLDGYCGVVLGMSIRISAAQPIAIRSRAVSGKTSSVFVLFVQPRSLLSNPLLSFEGARDGRTDTGGGWSKPRPSRVDAQARYVQKQRIGVKAEALKTQVEELRAVVNELFAQSSPSIESPSSSGLQLEEVSFSVQVNAKGQLSVLGTGGQLGGSGGITLKFKRPKS